MAVEKLAEGYGLIEGPVWVPDRGLLFSDVLGGGVFCLDAEGAVTTVFEHRRGIGGMSLHVDGGMVISNRDDLAERLKWFTDKGNPRQPIYAHN